MPKRSRPVEFANSEERLAVEIPRVLEKRAAAGLEGLVGSLTALVINVEPDRQRSALEEFLRRTGMSLVGIYRGPLYVTCVLRTPNSADILLRSRNRPDNPFRPLNDHPRSSHLPNTRLETLVFETPDIDRYVRTQRPRGVSFVTPEPIRTSAYSFIQTAPSVHTGTSAAFIQWHGAPRDYAAEEAQTLDWGVTKPALAHLANVGTIDHVALRVTAEHRDPAILELMSLTNYGFDTAIYVETLNSITNVTRHGSKDPAVVMTSGIRPFAGDMDAEPTEAFVFNYGPRTHHIAFATEDIDATFAAIKADGQEFLIDLVGSAEEGLKQTFTKPSASTLLVHEYIHRYGTFSGFFTKSNVTLLTRATMNQ
jgi:catechol 2,3-dioxygenase-like lactoylglutathione lyase family enzyme